VITVDLDSMLAGPGMDMLVIELFESRVLQRLLACDEGAVYLKYTSLAGETSYYLIARAARHNELPAPKETQ
jgi:hypothetical protein